MNAPAVSAPASSAPAQPQQYAQPVPVVMVGDQILYFKRPGQQPESAFVSRVNMNGRVAIHKINLNYDRFVHNETLMAVPHISQINPSDPQTFANGYWDLSARDKRFRELEERLAALESLVK